MHVKVFVLFLTSLIGLSSAFAAPAKFTYQGQIIKPNGQALESNSVQFTLEILSPEPELCVLYKESHTVNMTNSNGIFSLTVGEGVKPGDGSYEDLTSLADALDNSIGMVAPTTCALGPNYTADPSDGRKLRLTFDDGSGPVTLAQDHNVVSVPYASNASSLNGLSASEILTINSGTGFNLDQNNLEFVFSDANWSELQALLDGSSASFTAGAPTTDVNNNNQKIVNLADPDPLVDSDAVNVGYANSYIGGQQVNSSDLDALGVGEDGQVLTWDGSQWNSEVIDDVTKLPIAGGTMTGSIDMGNQNLLNANDVLANNNISASNDLGVGNNLSVTLDATVGNDLTVSGGIGVTNGINSAGPVILSNENEVRFSENTGNGSEYVSLKAPASLTSIVNLTLPDSDGDPGQYLQTDGSGVLSWQDVNAGVTQVFGRTGNVVATAGDYDANQINFDNTFGGDVDTATEVQGAIEELSNEKLAKSGDSMNGNLLMDLSGGTPTELRFQDTTTKYVGFRSPATINAPASFVWTLPDDDGGAGQVLQTSGAGVLSWVDKNPSDYVSNTVDLSAGSGLTGGGDLTANRSFDVGAGDGITVNADDVSVNPGEGIRVDASGVHVDIAGTPNETVVESLDSLLIRDNSDSGNLKEMSRDNFVRSETEVDSFVSNNGYLINGGNSGSVTVGSDDAELRFESNNINSMTLGTNGALQLNNPGSSTGSITFSSPGGSPGTIATSNSGNRRDIRFTDEGISLLASDDGTQPNVEDGLTILGANGRVGIGTSSPESLLHIENNAPELRLKDSDTGASSSLRTVNEGTLTISADVGNLQANSYLSFNVDDSEAVRINDSGNVGIGTTVPTEQLHIESNSNSEILLRETGDSAPKITLDGARTNSYSPTGLIDFDWDGNRIARIYSLSGADNTNKDDGELAFEILNNSSVVSFFKMNRSGNFGFDETTPEGKLEISLSGESTGSALMISSVDSGDGDVFNVLKSGQVGIGTSAPTSQLQVAGGVQIGDDLALCDGTKEGTLKYVGGSVSFCDGSTWTAFGTAAGGEVNDGINVGSGEGIFKAKNGVDLEFKTLDSANGKIIVSSTTDDVTLTLTESAFDPTAIPVGTTPLTATTLQDALVELEGAKVSSTRSIASGDGLTGGGDLSADRTLAVGAGNGINVNADDVEVVGGDAITVDGTGVHVDFTNETPEAAVATGDEILIYDVSAGGLRKMTRSNFVLSNAEVEAIIADDGYIIDGGNSPAASLNIGTSNGQELNLITNSAAAVTIDTTGQVGIGTTNPDGVLNTISNGPGSAPSFERIDDDNGIRNALRLIRKRSSTTAPGNGFGASVIFSLEGYTNDNVAAAGRVGAIWENTQTNDTTDRDSALIFETASDGNLPTEKLRITSEGNVGIGRVSPASKLDVAGTVRAEQICDESGANCRDISSGWGGGGDFLADGSVPMTGIFEATNGSAANPSVTFDGDEDTGVFRGAADSLGLSTGGSERVRIDSSGNVGIGTTTPSTLLDVDGALTTRGMASPTVSPAGQGRIYFDSTANKFRVSENNGAYVDLIGGGSSGDLLNGGNSGAVVVGSNDSTLALESNNTTALSFDTSQDATFAGRVYTERIQDPALTRYFGFNTNGVVRIFSSDSDIELKTNNNDDIVFTTNDTERVRVNASGNVGIGTTSPSTRLHLEGQGSTPTSVTLNNTGTSPNTSNIHFQSEGFEYARARGYSSDSTSGFLAFHTSTGSNLVEAMRIDEQGNVGIGTTAPASELDVAGTVRAEQICDESGANCRDISSGWGGGGDFLANGSVPMTGSFLAADGTAATPGISFNNDSDSGIFLSGTNEIAFSNAGTQSLLINASGNVGIGTQTASEKLYVSYESTDLYSPSSGTLRAPAGERVKFKNAGDTAGAASLIEFGGSDSSSSYALGYVGFVPDLSTSYVGDMVFGASTSSTSYEEWMRLTKDGNLGIGTTAPDGLLEVSAGASGDAKVYISADTDNSNDSDNPYLIFKQDGNEELAGIWLSDDSVPGTNNALNIAASAAQDNGIAFRTGAVDGGWESSPVRMNIRGNGRVGIGTTEPNYQFTVSNTGAPVEDTPGLTTDIQRASTIAVEGDGRAYFLGRDVTNNISFIMGSSSQGAAFAGSMTNHELQLRTNNNTRMTIDTSGDVGIGTDNPNSRLHVSGTVRATSFIGDGSGLTNISATETSSSATTGNYVINSDSDNSGGDGGVSFQTNGSEVASISSTGQLNASAGSAGAVGIGFQGDPDTGLFTSSADTLSFATNGSERMTLNSTGNVGIGTSAPDGKLHIASGTDISAADIGGSLVIDQGSTRVRVDGNELQASVSGLASQFQLNPFGGNVKIGANNEILVDALNSEIEFNGNVGIGTTDPDNRFHVYDDVTVADGGDHFLNNTTMNVSPSTDGTATEYFGSKIAVHGTGNNSLTGGALGGSFVETTLAGTGNVSSLSGYFGHIEHAGSGALGLSLGNISAIHNSSSGSMTGAYNYYATNSNLGGGTITRAIGFYAGNLQGDSTYGFYQDGSDDMNYFAGNIGVGTSNPGYQLHIYDGSGNATSTLSSGIATGNATLRLENSDQTWLLQTAGFSDDSLYVHNETTGDYAMAFSPSGNVGIGTTTPSYALEVQGDAGKSTGTAWINTSDRRLKDIHGDYQYGLEEILKLRTVRFNYKEGNPLGLPSDKEVVGFIAQEVMDVIPEAIRQREDGFYELDVDPIHWATVNAVQDLAGACMATKEDLARMQDLVVQNKRDIASLKGEDVKLKDEMKQLKTENQKLRGELDELKEQVKFLMEQQRR